MAATQPARFGDDWNDERVRSWLTLQPPEGINADYHVLQRAYQAMRPDDFERFIVFFLAQNRNIKAPGPDGQALGAVIAKHALAGEFLAVLQRHGG